MIGLTNVKQTRAGFGWSSEREHARLAMARHAIFFDAAEISPVLIWLSKDAFSSYEEATVEIGQ